MASKRTLTGKGKGKVSMKQHEMDLYTVNIPGSWRIKECEDKVSSDPGTPLEFCGSSFVFAPENEVFTLKIIGRRFNQEIRQTEILHLGYTQFAPEELFLDDFCGDFKGFAVCTSSCENCHRIWTVGYKDILLVIHYESNSGNDCQNSDRIDQIKQILKSLRRKELPVIPKE